MAKHDERFKRGAVPSDRSLAATRGARGHASVKVVKNRKVHVSEALDAQASPYTRFIYNNVVTFRENDMGFFSKILNKLGIGSAEAAPAADQASAADTAASATASAPAAASSAAAIPVTDVVSQLEQKAAANPQKLNWRTSIVDLLKLLDLDSSLAARKELATELGCPADKMGDSAQMNMWLHKTVLARIAQNGGNIPQDLLN